MMANDLLAWLQDWYDSQCDEDWEHEFGIKIETLDDPGWSLFVDLAETELEGKPLDPIKIERSDHDWLHCRIRDGKFDAACGPLNLVEALDIFRKWASEVPRSP